MNKITHILMIFLLSFPVLATGQFGDILIWQGDTLTLFSNPLELRNDIDSLRSKFFGEKETEINTACWRGYIAEWIIIESEIFLMNILSCNYDSDSIKADLSKLFSKQTKKGMIKADWITGDLIVPNGKRIHYVNSGYESFYEKEILLTFEKGKLTNKKEFDNSKSKKSIFTENNDSLQHFIYQNINWSKIPHLDKRKMTVIVFVRSGEFAKPDSIEIFRGANDEVFNEEALRVINLLPDWDIYYKHGQVYRRKWAIPVIFDEEKRKIYAR